MVVFVRECLLELHLLQVGNNQAPHDHSDEQEKQHLLEKLTRLGLGVLGFGV